MNRLAALVGVDGPQWLALTRIYLVMDFRRGGGARKAGSKSTHNSSMPVVAMVFGALINSLLITLLVLLIRDPLTAAVVMVTMGGATTSMLLMVDFAGSVIASEDYWVLAPRPVSSRTYFAARLSAVLAYIISFSLVLSLAPALTFLFARGLGVAGFVGAVGATVLASVAGAGLVIAVYTSLVTRVSASRLVPVISLVHLSGSMMAMAGFLVVVRGFDDPNFRDVAISSLDWYRYVPATWFAALVPALAGNGGTWEPAAAAGAVVLTGLLLWLACGQISLDSAARLTEAAERQHESHIATCARSDSRVPGRRSLRSRNADPGPVSA